MVSLSAQRSPRRLQAVMPFGPRGTPRMWSGDLFRSTAPIAVPDGAVMVPGISIRAALGTTRSRPSERRSQIQLGLAPAPEQQDVGRSHDGHLLAAQQGVNRHPRLNDSRVGVMWRKTKHDSLGPGIGVSSGRGSRCRVNDQRTRPCHRPSDRWPRA